jgi:hypothetical protein
LRRAATASMSDSVRPGSPPGPVMTLGAWKTER